MNIPLLDLFKKFTGRRGAAETAPAEVSHPVRVTTPKPTGERLSKTVMPNTTRTTSTPDFFKTVGDSVPNVRAAGSRALPPTVALALQPKVERAISLPLSDLVDRVPVGFLKPTESFDASQSILLKASEIEKGMADGKPAVSLFSIYEQVPDIFLRNVRPDDATQVAVPQGKVLEQLGKMQVRDDQEIETAVPQVETPILKVTIEDTERFGTKLPAVTTSANPPVKVLPPTAKAFSSAEPEPAAKEKITPTAAIPIPSATVPVPPKIAPRPSAPDPVAPARIPFKLPPKGTDETAIERVPASSSSSVPLSVPPPTRIPFKMTPPCNDLKPKLQIVPGVVAGDIKKPEEAAGIAPTNAKISLGLRAVVQNMPSFQLHRSADTVATDARFELPLSLVESQLATGRVAVPVKTFRDALPEEYKSLVVVDAGESPVLLPLQEVLTNLSPDLLKMRDDQVVEQVAEAFETPFSIKAAEDARRFTAELESSKKSDEAPVETKPPEAPQAQAATKPVVTEPSLKASEPAAKPVLKLSPIQPEQKAIAPVEAKTEIKFSGTPIKLASEVKPEATKPFASTAPAIEPKPEQKASIPTPAPIKVSLEPKPVVTPALKIEPAKPAAPIESALKPELAKPAPAISLPTEAKTQPVEKISAPTPAQAQSPSPSMVKSEVQAPVVSSSPLRLSVTSKPEPAPALKESAPKDVVSTPSLKVAAKLETPPAAKLMPTAPPPALSDPSQPLLQDNPVPSQEPAEPAALKPIVPAVPASGPLPPQRVNSDWPLPASVPNKPLEKPVEKAEVNVNAKAVVEEANNLNGISAATVLFEDGLALAGQLPEDVQAGGLCAMAPSILKKINRHTVETKFGQLSSMTLDWKNAQLTFFMAGAVCLGVMHTQPVLPAETHHRLTVLTGQLSRTVRATRE